MHRYFKIFLAVLFVISASAGYAEEDEDKRVEQLSARVKELSGELQKLTAELKDVIKDQDDAETASAAEAETVKEDGTEQQEEIGDLLKKIDKLAETQSALSEEVQGLKKSEETVTYVDANGNQVELGVVEDSATNEATGSVLQEYGNANDYSDSDDVVYVRDDPEYIVVPQRKPKVGISFYFGSPRRYRYNRWDSPWAVDPPWRVRRHYHRYPRRW